MYPNQGGYPPGQPYYPNQTGNQYPQQQTQPNTNQNQYQYPYNQTQFPPNSGYQYQTQTQTPTYYAQPQYYTPPPNANYQYPPQAQPQYPPQQTQPAYNNYTYSAPTNPAAAPQFQAYVPSFNATAAVANYPPPNSPSTYPAKPAYPAPTASPTYTPPQTPPPYIPPTPVKQDSFSAPPTRQGSLPQIPPAYAPVANPQTPRQNSFNSSGSYDNPNYQASPSSTRTSGYLDNTAAPPYSPAPQGQVVMRTSFDMNQLQGSLPVYTPPQSTGAPAKQWYCDSATQEDIISRLKRLFYPRGVKVDEVKFTPLTSNLSDDELVAEMQKGSSCLKYSKKSKKPAKKTIRLSATEDFFALGKSKFELRYIEEIRRGAKTVTLQKQLQSNPDIKEPLCLSLILVDNKTLDLSFPNENEFTVWFVGLVKTINRIKAGESELTYVTRVWRKMKKSSISSSQAESLLAKLNFSGDPIYVRQKIKEVDTNGNGRLDFDEFLVLFYILRSRTELDQLFEQYSANKLYMTDVELLRFMHLEQKETDMTLDACRMIIQQYESNVSSPAGISRFKFTQYMISNLNSALNPSHQLVYHNMKYPLTYYYIASSHNTYLEGDQLKSKSSVDMYIQVLKTGCRCIELDCWDGPDSEPIIYHGHTLTSKIKFKDVVKAIRDYAFVASPYPVILSIELHCTVPQQIIMATYFKDILGDMLAKPPAETNNNAEAVLPSPEDLKGKILIKGKSLRGQAVVDDTVTNEFDDDEEGKPKPPEKIKLAKELSDLVYLSSQTFKSFDTVKKDPWDMCSFAEGKMLKMVEKEPHKFLMYNVDQLSRIYPKGSRVDSSNYNPVPAWTCGSQLVALNYQTSSEPMWVNEGKFRDNGNCGYVLKPEWMCMYQQKFMKMQQQYRGVAVQWDPGNPVPFPSCFIKRLTVQVLSARQLPKISQTTKGEVVDPYVSVEVFGVASDSKAFKTTTVKNNGFNPEWNETFVFNFQVSEQAVLLIRIDDEENFGSKNRIGHYALPVHSIRPGYRIIKLLDDEGKEIPMCDLLCKFTAEYR